MSWRFVACAFVAVVTLSASSAFAQFPDSTGERSGLNGFGYEAPNAHTEELTNAIEKGASAIRERWFAKERIKRGVDATGTTIIECTLKRDGTTDDTQLIISSGDASLDEDARTTIGDALFRGLPRSFRGTELRFVFFFNLPSTKERPACSLLTLSPYKKVGGGVTAPRAIYQPVPEFGEEARRASYQGSMVLRLTVDAQGLPQDICVEQGMGMGLDERSIAAINTWKFEPGKENGIPVPVRISVETSFRLY